MTKNQESENQNPEAMNLFGKFIKIPMAIVYCFSSVFVGLLVGCIASITLPVFIPYQMIRIKYFRSGT